ncbi:MAG: hypothetical protein ACXACI_06120 [Candidatus Hodarchaeales archaeon]|jgi:hypothetical protein
MAEGEQKKDMMAEYERKKERMAESEQKKKEYRKASQLRVIWRRFRKHRMGLLGAGIFAIMLFLAIFADFIVPYEWERGAEALPDNGPTSASGKVIESKTNLVAVFGPQAQSHEDGTFIMKMGPLSIPKTVTPIRLLNGSSSKSGEATIGSITILAGRPTRTIPKGRIKRSSMRRIMIFR